MLELFILPFHENDLYIYQQVQQGASEAAPGTKSGANMLYSQSDWGSRISKLLRSRYVWQDDGIICLQVSKENQDRTRTKDCWIVCYDEAMVV